MTDFRKLLSTLEELNEDTTIELHDSFDIELNDDLLIESGVIDIAEDGIVIDGDDEMLKLLEDNGIVLEVTDWSKYDEPTIDRIKKGITKPVDRTNYNVPPAMRDPDQGKPGYEKRRNKLSGIYQGVSQVEPTLPTKVDEVMNFSDSPVANAIIRRIAMQHTDLLQKYGPEKVLQVISDVATSVGDVEEIGSSDVSAYVKDVKDLLASVKVDEAGPADEPVHPDKDADDKRWDDVEEALDLKTLRAAAKASAPDKTSPKAPDDNQKVPDKEIPRTKDGALDLNALRDLVKEEEMDEAKYQGREVPLGKPMAGDVKKSKVYVRKPNGKVVKVNFGDKKMRIKKSNPKRRKSFRARHNCKNPGPRWKARYWSCRAW